MILAQNWPKTAKSSWHCSFKMATKTMIRSIQVAKSNSLFELVFDRPPKLDSVLHIFLLFMWEERYIMIVFIEWYEDSC